MSAAFSEMDNISSLKKQETTPNAFLLTGFGKSLATGREEHLSVCAMECLRQVCPIGLHFLKCLSKMFSMGSFIDGYVK